MPEVSGQLATLDIVLSIIVLISALIGLYRGLVKELLSLLAWVAAFVVAIYYSDTLAAYVPSSWGGSPVRTVIAFVVLFIGTLVGASLLQWLLARLVAGTGLSGTDRFLGLLFGGARGLVVCVVLLMGLREVAHETSWWRASKLQPELLAFEDDVRALLGRARGMAEDIQLPDVLPDHLPGVDPNLIGPSAGDKT